MKDTLEAIVNILTLQPSGYSHFNKNVLWLILIIIVVLVIIFLVYAWWKNRKRAGRSRLLDEPSSKSAAIEIQKDDFA